MPRRRRSLAPLFLWPLGIALAIVLTTALFVVRGDLVLPFEIPGLSPRTVEAEERDPNAGKVPIPVAAVPIEPYTRLLAPHVIDPTTKTFAVRWMDPENVPEEALRSPAEILRRVLIRRKLQGAIFTERDFTPEGTREGITAGIPEGWRSMRVSASDDVKGLFDLLPGDRFDIVAVFPPATKPGDLAGLGIDGALEELVTLEAKANRFLAQPTVHTVVENGLAVTSVQIRQEPVSSPSLRSGAVTQLVPVQEMVIAVRPEQVARLMQAIRTEQAEVRCVARSGRPMEGEEESIPELRPRSILGGLFEQLFDAGDTRGSSSTGSSAPPLEVIQKIEGASKSMVVVPRGSRS